MNPESCAHRAKSTIRLRKKMAADLRKDHKLYLSRILFGNKNTTK